jgi:thiamine pyrophosphokinase
LIKFNTVFKKWHHLISPIALKTIKLQRSRAIQNKVHDKRLNKTAKVNLEVEMCISNNEKHAPQINEFTFTQSLEPQRVIELFKTFNFITILALGKIGMRQDQFISLISPLTQLQESNLIYIIIKKILKIALLQILLSYHIL